MKTNLLCSGVLAKSLFLTLIASFIVLVYFYAGCFAADGVDRAPFEILPWRVGQYVVYQITTFEGEGAQNRYKISIIAEEKIGRKTYFWVQADIWEHVTFYGFNKIESQLKKNLSFKYLIAPITTEDFFTNTSHYIQRGLFPDHCLKLGVQIGDGPWQWIEPGQLFGCQQVIERTPYAETPHAQGRIDFNKLQIAPDRETIDSPAGKFLCYRLSVMTGPREDYCDEGFELWRNPQVPIVGLVKLEFSITGYWEKWLWRRQHNKTLLDKIKSFYTRGVAGRRRPDTCVMTLIEYGQKP